MVIERPFAHEPDLFGDDAVEDEFGVIGSARILFQKRIGGDFRGVVVGRQIGNKTVKSGSTRTGETSRTRGWGQVSTVASIGNFATLITARARS